MRKSKTISLMTEMALFASLGFILDFFQGMICDFMPFWPNGGSVGIAMCATFLFCYRHGAIGLLCGLLTGLLTLFGGVWISPLAMNNPFSVFMQVGLDYFFGWTLVGLAGLFAGLIRKSNNKHRITFIVLSVCAGGLGKYLCHFLAGMLYWPSEDTTSQFIYSLVYNGSYMLPSIILCSVVMVVVIIKAPNLIKTRFQVEENKKYRNALSLNLFIVIIAFLGLAYSLYLYIPTIEFYNIEESYGELFSANMDYFFFGIIFLVTFILSLVTYIRRIKQQTSDVIEQNN